jgi:tetratricopeptide (TPR) repeat protein
MTHGSDVPPGRRKALESVRAEIEQELRAGRRLDPEYWRARRLELLPELNTLLDEILAAPETVDLDTAARTASGHVGAIPDKEHGASGSSPLTETMASSSAATRQDVAVTVGPDENATAYDPRTSPLGGPDPTIWASLDRGGAPPGETKTYAGGSGASRPRPSGSDPSEYGPLPAGQRVRYIGDYELIKVLGQGGMGVVYKAWQISLNRPVAIKMIRDAEFAGDVQIRRFQNEAEAVALLDHPGIVPIYEIGHYEDKRYFSMKLIEGDGLDRRLKSLAKAPKAAARLVAEAADAVFHAHQRGILHRDLKPANILIDGQGHPHVTDFGLAKRIEADSGLTVTGTIMGTPGYMAPEQALGRNGQITVATDVYGLGATLYATLAGKPPFASDSVLETLEHVRNDPPQPPSRANAELPRELEIICLKCLEKDAARRYASARDLADDLRRWLNDEPISARRVSQFTRARLWCKRKPAQAGLIAALALALVGGVAGITWQWREALYQRNEAVAARDLSVREEKAARAAEADARSARDAAVASEKVAQTARDLSVREEKAARAAEADAQTARDAAVASEKVANTARDAAVASEKVAQTARDAAVASEKVAQAAREQAEQNALIAGRQATLALKTIQDLIVQVREKLQGPGLFDLKTALLDSALRHVDLVADVYEKSTSKEATTAAVLMELGGIYRQLGQSEKSYRVFEKVLGIAKVRIVVKKGSDAARQNVALAHAELASTVEEYRRDMKAALQHNKEALKVWEDIRDHPKPEGYPIDPVLLRAQLGESYQRVGINHYRLGELTTALEYYRKAHNVHRALVDEFPGNPSFRLYLTFSTMAIAETSFRLKDRETADQYYADALDQRERLATDRPSDLVAVLNLSGVVYMIGEFKMRTGDLVAARRHLERARDLRRDVVKAEGRNVYYKRDLAIALYRLGNLHELAERAELGREAFEEARKIQEDLVNLSERNDKRQMELMLTLAHLGTINQAAEIADRLAAGPQVDRELRIELARCYAQCARFTAADQAERRQTFLVKATESLRTAVAEGYRDRVFLETEPDLRPLHDREQFKTILNGM